MDFSLWHSNGPLLLGVGAVVLAIFVGLDLPALLVHLALAAAAFWAFPAWPPRAIGFVAANLVGIGAGLALRALLTRRRAAPLGPDPSPSRPEDHGAD